MRAVTLMAGVGSRLEQPEPHPKVLLRFDGAPLFLAWQLLAYRRPMGSGSA